MLGVSEEKAQVRTITRSYPPSEMSPRRCPWGLRWPSHPPWLGGRGKAQARSRHPAQPPPGAPAPATRTTKGEEARGDLQGPEGQTQLERKGPGPRGASPAGLLPEARERPGPPQRGWTQCWCQARPRCCGCQFPLCQGEEPKGGGASTGTCPHADGLRLLPASPAGPRPLPDGEEPGLSLSF